MRRAVLVGRIALVVCVAASLTGCMVGPNYKRPSVASPPQFRAAEPQPAQASLGDVKWFNLFEDSTLRDLIEEGLKANYDIRIAAQRILEAEGRPPAPRSAIAPQMSLQADAARAGVQSPIQSTARGFGAAIWEL